MSIFEVMNDRYGKITGRNPYLFGIKKREPKVGEIEIKFMDNMFWDFDNKIISCV